jgi:copper/silver efflux system protein
MYFQPNEFPNFPMIDPHDQCRRFAAPIVGGMITSTIHVLILVPVFFAMMKGRAIRHGGRPQTKPEGTADENLAEQPH